MDMRNHTWTGIQPFNLPAPAMEFVNRGEDILPLLQAACTLMAADSTLSPNDAVTDVLQLYGIIAERTRTLQ